MEDVFRIIRTVRVVGDAAAFVGADLILIDDPVERGAIAADIQTLRAEFHSELKSRCDERALVFAQLHPLDAPIKLRSWLLNSFHAVFRLLFIVDVDFSETLADVGERAKVRRERNARIRDSYSRSKKKQLRAPEAVDAPRIGRA